MVRHTIGVSRPGGEPGDEGLRTTTGRRPGACWWDHHQRPHRAGERAARAHDADQPRRSRRRDPAAPDSSWRSSLNCDSGPSVRSSGPNGWPDLIAQSAGKLVTTFKGAAPASPYLGQPVVPLNAILSSADGPGRMQVSTSPTTSSQSSSRQPDRERDRSGASGHRCVQPPLRATEIIRHRRPLGAACAIAKGLPLLAGDRIYLGAPDLELIT